MLGDLEFIGGDQALILRIDQVVQDFNFGRLGDSDKVRKLTMSVAAKSFCDVPWP